MNQEIEQLVKHIKSADAILVGAGSGMSNAAGMDFWYEASPIFLKYMKPYYDKYHFQGLFNGFYTRFDSKEERWAYILKSLELVFNVPPQKPTYEYLKKLVKNKPVHFITTNQDGLFNRFFDNQQVSEIQGSDYFFQSTNTQSDKNLYSAKDILEDLLPKIKNNILPREYFPKSKVDGAPLTLWVRGPEFLEDQKYYEEYQKINEFLAEHQNKKILFLEMGVGRMTPMFIQEPFWALTRHLPQSFYVNINPKDALTNDAIKDRSLLIKEDINEALKRTAAKLEEQ